MMMKIKTRLWLPYLLAALIVLQPAWPGALSLVRGTDFNISAYLCNISDQGPSLETSRAMTALLKSLGKDVPNQDENNKPAQHCPDCILFELALIPPVSSLRNTVWTQIDSVSYFQTIAFIFQAQGPPLGGRAPPLSFNQTQHLRQSSEIVRPNI